LYTLKAQGPCNMRNTASSQPQQMLHSNAPSLLVIRQQAQSPWIGHLRIGIEHRDTCLAHINWWPRIDTPAGHNNAINALRQQRIDKLALTFGIIARIAQ